MRHNKNLTLSEVPLQLQQSNQCQATSGVTEIIIKKPKKDETGCHESSDLKNSDPSKLKLKDLPPFSKQNTCRKFPPVLSVIDRLDQSPPITAQKHDVKKVRRSH